MHYENEQNGAIVSNKKNNIIKEMRIQEILKNNMYKSNVL